ncbi:hypothetical protein G7Y89_g6541 [Cudoniella acicularis]|uniref:NAD dependent epimerase/dehydratase n=1 Tax=Cudoniella acicularis TaxID=354080 RepID=A0A8H4W5E4_9HELO|nr:hypothetical protein G7Y89_g6541 [Cudoniella acicularis]
MATIREVDKIPSMEPRPREMQVLCLGLSRTSTMTMYTALKKLGYKPYHMIEPSKPGNKKYRHINCWVEALQNKIYGDGKLYGPKDFDKILQEYSAVTDMPCVNFSEQLVAAFPNAKVVLTQRDPASWVKSCEASFYTILSWRIWRFLRWLEPDGLGATYQCLQLALTDWTFPRPWTDREALAAYMPKHVAHVRSLLPPENLLEFHPRDGWEPLCKFLGKKVPNEPFPFVNKGNTTVQLTALAITIKLIRKSFPYILAIGVGVIAWKWMK